MKTRLFAILILSASSVSFADQTIPAANSAVPSVRTSGEYVNALVEKKIADWNKKLAEVTNSFDRNNPDTIKAINIATGSNYNGQTVTHEMASDAVISAEIETWMPPIPDQWLNISMEHLAQLIAKSLPNLSGGDISSLLKTVKKPFDNGSQGYELFVASSPSYPSAFAYYSPNDQDQITDTDDNNLVHSVSLVLDRTKFSTQDYTISASNFISMLTTLNKEDEDATVGKQVVNQIMANPPQLDDITQIHSTISFSSDENFIIVTFTPSDNPITR